MKKLLLLFFIFHGCCLFSQKNTYTGIVLVDSIPEEMLPPGVTELGFVTAGENNQPVGFGYEIGELDYKIIAKLGNEYSGFNGTDVKAFFRNDTIFFQSHVKYKSIQTINYYSWDSKKLSFLETYTHDPSKEAEQQGEAALRKKEIKEAAEFYNLVEYAPVAIQAKTAYNLLGVAHYLAKDAAMADNYKEAVEYLDGAFIYHVNRSMIESKDEFAYNKIVMATFETKQIDSLGPWIANYAYYLYKAGSFEKCIKIASFVNMCYPKLADTFLVRADAMYDMQQPDEAMPFYDRYVALMMSKGEESNIPPRALERYK
jgi:hypothetical protein